MSYSVYNCVLIIVFISANYANSLFLNRIDRNCKNKGHEYASRRSGAESLSPAKAAFMQESKFTLFLLFISCLIFLLMFLGIIKGLIGLFILPKVGSYGMHLLIDLPRPLIRYQEKELACRTVVYDVGGWPIHPDTLERTVRILPKRTEFCLNTVFFLAYPIAAVVFLCGFCCCIRNYDRSKDSVCFKRVQIVRLTKNLDKNRDGAYNGEDQDTKYVLDAMKKSKESLNDCACDCDCDQYEDD